MVLAQLVNRQVAEEVIIRQAAKVNNPKKLTNSKASQRDALFFG
jgi:hypothetical protein